MTLSTQRLEYWTGEANSVEPPAIMPVPLHILLSEAGDVADFVHQRWTATDELPGLESAGKRMSPQIGSEIEELKEAIETVQSQYLSTLNRELSPKNIYSESIGVLDEMIAVSEWHAIVSENPEVPQRVYRLSGEHALCFNSIDGMINALYDYASHIQGVRDEVHQLGGFDSKHIERAFELATRLIEIEKEPTPELNTVQALVSLKDRLAAMLHGRVEFVRKAARFVFRFHPRVLREVLSARVMLQEAAEARAEKLQRTYERREQRDYTMSYLPPNSGYMPKNR